MSEKSALHATNLIKAFRRAEFKELNGLEVLALSVAIQWLTEFAKAQGQTSGAAAVPEKSPPPSQAIKPQEKIIPIKRPKRK